MYKIRNNTRKNINIPGACMFNFLRHLNKLYISYPSAKRSQKETQIIKAPQ